MRLRLSAARSAVFATGVSVLLFGGSRYLRDTVLSLRGPAWLSAILFLAVLFALFASIELPFAYVGGHRWERACGLSSQTFVAWLKDLAKGLVLGLSASIVTGSVVLWLLAAWPAWWWVVAWAFGVVVSAVLGFLAPILLVPIFYRFRPLDDPSLRSRFGALAAKAKVPIVGVFELRASEKTRRSNAAVMGFGRTRRVILTDTLLQHFSPEEVETVLAHELAHQKHGDPIRGFAQTSLVSFLVLALAGWVYSIAFPSFGIDVPNDMSGLPLLATLLAVVSIPFRPLELFASRSREARADRFSLDLTGDSANFAGAMVKLHDRNLGVVDPGPWERWLFYSHPSGRDRVAMARAFRRPTA